MNDLQTLFAQLDIILSGCLDFISQITLFIYQQKLLLLIAVAPITLVSIKVLRRIFKL